MKLSLLRIVVWTVIFGLICHADGKKSGGVKKKQKNSKSGPKFTYLGTMNNAPVKTDYFVTTGSATWQEHLDQCERLFDNKGTLISFNTEEEWKFITRMLGLQGDGGRYWTSGMWSDSNDRYEWLGHFKAIDLELKWDKNHPTPNPMDETRILIRQKTIQESFFQTEFLTENYRAICEVTRD